MFKIVKLRYVFERYGSIEKNIIYKIGLPFNFTKVWANLVQIGSLVTEIHLGENVCSILYNINLFKRYDQYEKKFINKTILVLDFTSAYQILYASVH